MTDIRKIGSDAEKKVCLFLQKQGLKLLAQNFRCVCGEIDLIMQDGEDIIFIEVRSRSSTDFGTSVETVDLRKQKKLVKTAVFYLQKQQWFDKVNCRFDIVGVEENKFEWIKNAFLAGN